MVGNVELYGLPSCSKCKTVCMVLDRNGIEYSYIDVSGNESFPHEVPSVYSDGFWFDGFRNIILWVNQYRNRKCS